jgi:O-antigen/teichoic acid export membrane protein
MMAHIGLAATILLLYAVQDPLDSVLQAEERLGFSSFSKICGQLIYMASGTIFLLVGWGITGLILASLGNILATAALIWHQVERKMGGICWQIQPRLWPSLLMAALPFGLIGLALNWSQKIDTVILSLYWPAETIGWYNAAYNLVLSAIIVSNAFNIAFFPSMTKKHSQQLPLTAGKIYSYVCKYLFTFSLPLAVGTSILSQPIVSALYGPAYIEAAAPLAILAWVIPLIFLSEFLRYMHLVSGLEKNAARLVIAAALGNLILNLIFIPLYGLTAAAITTVCTEAALVGLYWQQLRSLMPLKLMVNAFWKPTIAAAVMAGIILVIQFPLSLEIVLGVIIFTGMLSLLKFLEAEEKLIIRQVLSRLLAL